MDLQRDISLNMVRVTEVAALKASRWMGNGDKNNADKAAVDGMRGMMDLLDIKGRIVIGEGEKDEAPMLYIGEQVGSWGENAPEVDIAVDPIDGTRLVANGLPNALAVIAVGERNAIAYLPCFYVKKLAYGSKLRGFMDINCSIRENLKVAAAKLNKTVHELTVAILDRDRHKDYIKEIRECGARIKLITDGDVAAAIATCMEDGRIDLYLGIGGAPEAVLAAAAIRCMGGDLQVKLTPKDDQEMEKILTSGYDIDKVYFAKDLAKGENVVFACTGITDGDLLPGIKFTGQKAISHSLVMRNKTKTIRYIQAEHNLKYKTIPSKELKLETSI
ncbi:MAG: fructose,6-bisphosphatase [Clostridiales bacterium]|nr:fructose,6-bisphosphatase [Clostridiales bacterium]